MNEYDDRILQWISAYNLLNSKGQPFEWKEHEFMIDPLCDWHPRQGWLKGSQVGGSEVVNLKTFFATKYNKWNVVYTLPTDTFLQKFVPPKVDRIIQNNPQALGDITGGVTLKKVGTGLDQRFIYYMGTFSSKSSERVEETDKGVSVTSDLNIHDEASRSDQYVLTQLVSRLSDSDYKGRWLFDNPTYPLMGADTVYSQSDQRVWVVKCSKCNYRQYIDWHRLDKQEFESGSNHCWIDPINRYYSCGKCQKELSAQDRMTGEWVARFPSVKDYRGYWIPQLIYAHHKVSDLLILENDPQTPKSYFYNMVLARPYLGSDVSVTRKDIIANLDNQPNSLIENVMGVDQGEIKTYVIGNEKGVFLKGQTKDWDEIERIFNKYNALMVVDNLPNTRYPRKLVDRYGDRVWRAIFDNNSDQKDIASFISKKDNPNLVLIKREDAFEVLANKYVNRERPIQMNQWELEDFISEWGKLIRVTEEDSKGNERFKWIKSSLPCDFPFADLYCYIGLLKTARSEGRILEPKRQGGDARRAIHVVNGRIDNSQIENI